MRLGLGFLLEFFQSYGVSMAVALASMTASLASKLFLSDAEEPVDLDNLCLPDKGFVARQFYLIGKLNSSRPVVLDSLSSAVRSMWCLVVPVDVQVRGERFCLSSLPVGTWLG